MVITGNMKQKGVKMPVELYLQVSKVFINFYKSHRSMSARLCCDLTAALVPICKKIDDGEYDIKDEK